MISVARYMINRLPASVQETARIVGDLIPESLKYGKPYRDALQLLAQSKYWDLQQLGEYQDNLLRQLIKHCSAHVPYYRSLFKELGLGPEDIRTQADLKKLPFLTRQIVRNRRDELKADNISRWDTLDSHTGGSTGTPLDFSVSRSLHALDRALVKDHFRSLGWMPRNRIAVLRGDSFADPGRRSRYLPGSRQLVFSFRNVDDRALMEIVETLAEFEPHFIVGFPSILQILCRWMQRHEKEIKAPKSIITSSETLQCALKEMLENVLKAPVIDFYGHNELTVAAVQYGCRDMYHVRGELGIMELEPVAGTEFEMVGTSLHNYAMPFIRYRTGDMAMKHKERCRCGLDHSVLSAISGRLGDIIITPESKYVSPSIIDYCFNNLDEIKEGQIVQEDLDRLRVKIVPWDGISEGTRAKLLADIDASLQSPRMVVSIEVVDEIPRTPGGKRLMVISNLKTDDLFGGS
ncbi:MAG: phenylacetate--CoA ligase family protein [Thermodesulfobacteriota bacterium]